MKEAPAATLDDDERELKDIFLEEAREVVQTGLEATRSLASDPADLGQQSTLRRSFHTLKGSARMVGLNEFGEAAWAMEQLLNSWLAEQKPASAALVRLADKAMQGLGRWVEEAIAAGDDAQWNAQAFRKAADGLRLDNRLVDLVLPGAELQLLAPELEPSPDFDATQMFAFEATQVFDARLEPDRDVEAALASEASGKRCRLT